MRLSVASQPDWSGAWTWAARRGELAMSCRRSPEKSIGSTELNLKAAIKGETQATIRNIPFDSPPADGKRCVRCGNPATVHAWFAKAY